MHQLPGQAQVRGPQHKEAVLQVSGARLCEVWLRGAPESRPMGGRVGAVLLRGRRRARDVPRPLP